MKGKIVRKILALCRNIENLWLHMKWVIKPARTTAQFVRSLTYR